MTKREAKSSVLFRHWIRANPQISGSYEIKDSRSKNSIPFSEIKEHQTDFGMAIKSSKGVLIRVQGVNGEPDYVYLRNAPAWVVIKFPRSMEIIDMETLILEKNRSKQKSLTAVRAKEISVISVKTR